MSCIRNPKNIPIQKVASPLKGILNEYPSVSTSETSSRERGRGPTLHRADTLKPLPRDPPSRSYLSRLRQIHIVGPHRSTRPFESTLVFHLVFLLLFTALLSLAAKFPVHAARTAFISISVFGFVLLLGTIGLDAMLQSESLQAM